MPNNVKHVKKMRKHFNGFVYDNGVERNTIKNKSNIKDTYRIGDKEVMYNWHYTYSSGNIVTYIRSDLKKMSYKLGINEEWREYINENTISMHCGLIGDLMK